MLFHKLSDNNFFEVKHFAINDRSIEKDFYKAFEIAKASDLILLPLFIKVKAYRGTVGLSIDKLNFIKKILRLKIPAVVLSLGNPYLLSLIPASVTYLCAYGDSPVSQIAMMKAISGEIKLNGKLPISIPRTKYSAGHGITT